MENLGYGVGLRTVHYEHVLRHRPSVDWFEVISENFMVPGGKPRRYLRQVRALYPVVLHGVSLSIGSADALDLRYLDSLRALIDEVEPTLVSDHLCWTSTGGTHSHDLLPLPANRETADYLVSRISAVQEALDRPMAFENITTYMDLSTTGMDEWAFVLDVLQRSGAGLLLDINNLYINAFNHGYDASAVLERIPRSLVQQIHVAGHSHHGTHIIDTHDAPVSEPVLALYAQAVARFGEVATLLERDGNIPPFEQLEEELSHVEAAAKRVLSQRAA